MAEARRSPLDDRLLGVLAHDMRNPIMCIQSALELLGNEASTSDPSGGERRAALAEALTACQVLDRYTKNLQVLTGVSATPRVSSVPLRSIVEGVVVRMNAQATVDGVRVVLDTATSVDRAVAVDASLLALGLENLVWFRSGVTPRGTIITVSHDLVTPDEAFVSVSDEADVLLTPTSAPFFDLGRGLAVLTAQSVIARIGASLSLGAEGDGWRGRVLVPMYVGEPPTSVR